MKVKETRYYFEVAEATSKMSTAIRLKVGSVAVIENRIISYGYNGTAPGDSNECEIRDYIAPEDIPTFRGSVYLDEESKTHYTLRTKPEVIHAEVNTILKAARQGQSTLGAVMFITHAPCLPCAIQIYAAGFSAVYYAQEYRDQAGVEYLREHGVTCVHKDKLLELANLC